MNKDPEYCLFWVDFWVTCMTKSEWASWAQFLGVVGSLLMTLYFPLRSEAQRREQEQRSYLNERYALSNFKEDVVHFVGPLMNRANAGNDLNIDEIQYGKILERIGYFDIRLHDSSAKKLLLIIRQSLRTVDGYRHAVENKKHYAESLTNTFKVLFYSRFNPEDEDFFYARSPYHEMCSEGGIGSLGPLDQFLSKVKSIFRSSGDSR